MMHGQKNIKSGNRGIELQNSVYPNISIRAIFEVLTAVLLKQSDLVKCQAVSNELFPRFRRGSCTFVSRVKQSQGEKTAMSGPEKPTAIFRNVGKHILNNTAQHPRTLERS